MKIKHILSCHHQQTVAPGPDIFGWHLGGSGCCWGFATIRFQRRHPLVPTTVDGKVVDPIIYKVFTTIPGMSLNKKNDNFDPKKTKNTSSAPFSHQKRETKNEVREAAATRICKKFWVHYCDWASWIKLSYQRFTQKTLLTYLPAYTYIYIILVYFTMNIYDHITYMNIHIYIYIWYIISYILQQEETLRLLKVWVMTWSVPDRIIMSILRCTCGTVNIHPVLNLID